MQRLSSERCSLRNAEIMAPRISGCSGLASRLRRSVRPILSLLCRVRLAVLLLVGLFILFEDQYDVGDSYRGFREVPACQRRLKDAGQRVWISWRHHKAIDTVGNNLTATGRRHDGQTVAHSL